MARKPAAPKKIAPAPKTAAAPVTPVATSDIETPVATTEVRKTVAPKASPAGAAIKVTPSKAPVPLTYERIAERAYYISQSNGGSEHDNWLRAEAELKSELA